MLTIRQKMLDGSSAANASATTPACFKHAGTRTTTHHIVWSAAATAGGVIVEGADASTYAGTWAPIANVTCGSSSSQNYVHAGGTFGAIRHRVSTVVTGGTVTSYITGEGD